MKLYLYGHDYKYAAEQMLLTLFPAQRPEYPAGPPAPGEDALVLSLHRGAVWATATAALSYGGREYRAARRCRTAELTDPLSTDRALQRILKLAFYDAGTAARGGEPPWGALTGVRPVKIPTKAMLAGASPAQAERLLRDTYRVTEGRRRLAMDCAGASLAALRSLAPGEVSLYVGIELLLLLALFGVACLYTGGTWFLSAALWTVFGLGIALLPLLLRQLPLPWNWSRHKAVVYLSFESILLLAGLAWEGRTGDFPLPMLPIALLCLALPWGWLGALRYLPLGRWFRAGVGLAWTGLWIWLAPFVLDQIYLHMGYFTSTPYQLILPIDFHNWAAAMSANVMFLIILGFLLLGLLCVVAGILWRRTHPRTSAPEA